MRLGTSALDASPRHMLDLVAQAAANDGHDVLPALDPKHSDVTRIIKEARHDLVMLIGLSTSPAEADIISACAKDNVPVFAMADSWGTLQRPWLKTPGISLVKQLTGAFAAFPDDVDQALKFGYRAAHYQGPPPHWLQKLHTMMHASELRSALRKRVGDGPSTPFVSRDRLLYVAGSKRPASETNALLNAALNAAREENFVVHFHPHPAEGSLDGEAASQRKEMENRGLQLASEITAHPRVEQRTFTDEELVELADVTFYTGGGPTSSILAAMRGKRLLYAHDPRMAKQVMGATGWLVADRGAAVRVASPMDVRKALKHVLSIDGFHSQADAQQKHFPVVHSTPEEAANAVIRMLQSALR